MTRTQVRSYSFCRVRDVAQIGIVILVQRRRDTDNDGIHLLQPGIIAGSAEPLCSRRLNLGGRDTKDVRAPSLQSGNLALIDVEPGDGKLLLGIEKRERESDVAESDYSDARSFLFNLGLQFRKQRGRN